ncbi:MAG: hypothetical protein ABEK16_00880 [Candidatus Nanohalobium sp.]
MIKKLFKLTPLGRADSKIRAFLEMRLEDHQFERYNDSLNRYRNAKIAQQAVRVLLYASIITSVAATFNVNLSIINKIASYLGFTVILALYALISYFSMLYREDYHVQRDILIATAAEERLKMDIEGGELEIPGKTGENEE